MALLIGALLVAGHVVIWRSSNAMAVAADEAARAEQAIRPFKHSRCHVVGIQPFLTDAAAVGEATFSEAGELEATAAGARAHADATHERMLRTGIAGGVMTLLCVIVSCFGLARMLLRLLGGEPATVVTAGSGLAAGDLTQVLQVHPNDQGSLFANIGAAQAGRREAVGASRNGSQEALGTAAKLAAEAARGVDGSRPQCEAASAMSSSVEQMARNVTQTADFACSVRQHGEEAEARAQQEGNELRKLAERSAGPHAH